MASVEIGLKRPRRMYDTSVFEYSQLSNGIPVWLQRPPILTDESGILIAVLPHVGSRQDPSDAPGLAHFFEHIPFRGTQGKQDKIAITRPIAREGGEIDANTTQTRTLYSAELPGDCFNLAAETIAEMVAWPLLRSEDVEAEKGVILQEIARHESDGRDVALRQCTRSFFESHPLGHDVVGESGVVRTMSVDLVRGFHKRFYHAGNIVLICGGSFASRSDAIEVLEQRFGSIPLGRETALPNPDPLPFGKRGRVAVVNPKAGRDIMRFIYSFGPISPRDMQALNLLGEAVSYGYDSPLMIQLREKRGWVYEHGLLQPLCLPDIHFFTFTCPTDRVNFGPGGALYREALSSLREDYLEERLRGDRVSRKSAFIHPVEACRTAVEDIVVWGAPQPQWAREELRDLVTPQDIFRWRDWLLQTEPFVVEITTS